MPSPQRLAPFATAFLLAACAAPARNTASTANTTAAPAPASAPVPPHPRVARVTDIPPAIAAAVAAPDRSEADRVLDAGRQPAALLAFFGVAPGQRVAELFAGGGYTAELLARTVGESGRVFGQNNRFVLERFAREPWAARLASPALRNVTRVDRELDDPLPAEAHDLDAVLFVLAYHDSVWQHTDRAAMNRAVFRALRPGGVYGIVDHSAAEGHGTSDTQTLHRIEEPVLIGEVLAAGFRLDAEADFLRNPSDPRDWNDSPRAAGERRGTSDRFVLRFVKPQ